MSAMPALATSPIHAPTVRILEIYAAGTSKFEVCADTNLTERDVVRALFAISSEFERNGWEAKRMRLTRRGECYTLVRRATHWKVEQL